jgi:hypothetical protein
LLGNKSELELPGGEVVVNSIQKKKSQQVSGSIAEIKTKIH